MSEASIKGVAIQPVVQLTHELVESGQISWDQLEARLEARDLAGQARALDDYLDSTGWRGKKHLCRQVGLPGANYLLLEVGARRSAGS